MTCDEIKRIIRATTRARRLAHEVGDAGAKAAAISAQYAAKRRAGAMIEADPSLAAKFGKSTAAHCLELARLSDKAFAARVEAVARRAVAQPSAPRTGEPCPRIRMNISPWIRTSDGAITRTLTCVDDA
jgi:hypothetical protein